jgi:hypothetical protein
VHERSEGDRRGVKQVVAAFSRRPNEAVRAVTHRINAHAVVELDLHRIPFAWSADGASDAGVVVELHVPLSCDTAAGSFRQPLLEIELRALRDKN